MMHPDAAFPDEYQPVADDKYLLNLNLHIACNTKEQLVGILLGIKNKLVQKMDHLHPPLDGSFITEIEFCAKDGYGTHAVHFTRNWTPSNGRPKH